MPVTPVRRTELIRRLTDALSAFRRIADDATGPDLDVRLYVEPGDSSWWLSTGDVQYDQMSADLCAAHLLWVSMTPQEVGEVADALLQDIDFQHGEECCED